MRVAFINTTASGDDAPSRLMLAIAKYVAAEGGESLVLYGRGEAPRDLPPHVRAVRVGSRHGVLLHAAGAYMLDREGFGSSRAARQAINELKEFHPDVVNLHNLHGHFINEPMLLSGLQELDTPVVVTLHDQWLMTGRCAFPAGCDGWLLSCGDCADTRRRYPATLFNLMGDRRRFLHASLLLSIGRLALAVPSEWMKSCVISTALRQAPVYVIRNGVDKEIFCHEAASGGHEESSGMRLLAVANRWEPRKRPELLLEIASLLDGEATLTMVGPVPEKLQRDAPANVRFLPLVRDLRELAALYGSADALLAPSVAESFGMTVAEALACGTPALVSCHTALPEHIRVKGDGVVVRDDTPRGWAAAVRQLAKRTFLPGQVTDVQRMCYLYYRLFKELW